MTDSRSLFFAGALMAMLSGCVQPIDQRGNQPDTTTLDQIKPGQTDKATVTRLLGSPSSIAAFDDNTWYYISQRTRDVAFFKTQLLDQKVVAINFDQNGLVHNVTRRTMDDRRAIDPAPGATPAPGREFTFLEQLIGNFGRFSGGPAGQSSGGGGGGGGGVPGGSGTPPY
ncbi:MAG TPA: outer membrane protein assembly factor BamE [Stellaceae bacterium]|nr:outer membrane protein assembly factor BamE [Stellaceae bacterium]